MVKTDYLFRMKATSFIFFFAQSFVLVFGQAAVQRGCSAHCLLREK